MERDEGVRAALVDASRSMLRLSWAVTVFSAQQAANLVTSAGTARPAAADAFDAVTHAVEGQFGGIFRGAYRTVRNWMPGPRPRQTD